MNAEPLSPTLLAELIAAKFSHDVAGPVSAVSNGVELMAENLEDASMQTEAIELLRMSSTELRSRMQLFRYAYGVISGGGQSGVQEIETALKDYFQYIKVDCALEKPEQGAEISLVNFYAMRFIINAVLLVASLLIGKATIRIALSSSGELALLKITATALKTRQDGDVEAMLSGGFDAAKLTVKNIQAFMTFHFAKELGANITLMRTDASVEFKAQCPHKTIC